MTLAENVARNVAAIRRQRGLSQEQLGKATGLHRTWIGAVERGDRNLTLASVEKLASALGVDAVELVGRAGSLPWPSVGAHPERARPM